jgi:hypothetical protein
VLILVTAGAWYFLAPRNDTAKARTPEVGLRLSSSGESLVLEWNRSAVPVILASHGELLVRDGNAKTVRVLLDPEKLRKGRITYVRQSGDIEVRMRVYSSEGARTEEMAQYIGPPPGFALATQPAARSAMPFADVRGSETMNLSRGQQAASPQERAVPEVGPRPRSRSFRPPGKQKPKPVAVAAQLQPPQLAAGQISGDLASPPQVLASLPIRPPLPRPVTGRAIWTGDLRKGGLLLIDGSKPSAGALTGRFPEKAATFRVSPGELVDGGIVIHSSDELYRNTRRTEVPSAHNGWNVTSYNWDPKRSASIRIIEAPAPQNGWKRLVIRSDANVSVIVLDWETTAGRQ